MKDTFIQDDFLQDWDDFEDTPFNQDEDWEHHQIKETAKQLFKKWGGIIFMLKGMVVAEEDVAEDAHYATAVITEMMATDALVVQAKIRGCYNATTYAVLMENAAIIRSEAQAIKTHLLTLQMMDKNTKQHTNILRKEIDDFRLLFKEWVALFAKDEYEDEWGLFV